MLTAVFFTQGMIVVGLVMVLLTLLIGIEIGIDLLLVGSILIVSGFVGMWTGSTVIGLVVATLLAIAYVLYGRSLIKQKLVFRTQATNVDKLIGQVGTVKKTIEAGEYGIVKMGDEEWRAHSVAEIEPGTKIKVTSVEGVTLEVEKQ